MMAWELAGFTVCKRDEDPECRRPVNIFPIKSQYQKEQLVKKLNAEGVMLNELWAWIDTYIDYPGGLKGPTAVLRWGDACPELARLERVRDWPVLCALLC